MSEEIIKVDVVEHKTSKNGKHYMKVNKKYSVFEEELMKTFDYNKGKNFKVDVAESNGFYNIRAIIEETSQQPSQSQTASPSPKEIVEADLKDSLSNEFLIRKERPNSAEFGKAGNRIKLYFDTAEDLESQKRALEEAGLWPIEIEKKE